MKEKNTMNIKTNDKGYVVFRCRNFGWKGDRGTYAKVSGDKITICRAKNGLISEPYEKELIDFCRGLCVVWQRIPVGGRVEVPYEVARGQS